MHVHSGSPRWGFRTAGLVVVALEVLFFALAVIGDAGWSDVETVHVVGALGFTGIFGAGLVAMLVSSRARAGALQAIAAALAVLVAAAIVGNPDNVGGQAGVFDWAYLIFILPALLLALWYLRGRRAVSGASPDVVLIGIVLVAAIPLAFYGIDAALTQRNSFPPAADPHHNGHWITMAQLAFAIPLAGLVAAWRPAGWQLTVWSVTLATGGLGAASILWPTSPSSLGVGGGWLLVFGAGLFVATAMSGWRRVLQPRGMAPNQFSRAA